MYPAHFASCLGLFMYCCDFQLQGNKQTHIPVPVAYLMTWHDNILPQQQNSFQAYFASKFIITSQLRYAALTLINVAKGFPPLIKKKKKE